MTETLLRTKLFVPPLRPNFVLRPQLISKLNKGLRLGRKLTLISAPAGSGKTTLVSSWIDQLTVPVAWLSLDEGDNQPVQFVFYILAALQAAECSLSDSLIALLRSRQPPPIETILILLINDLANQSDKVLLVLDDYHVIHELEIHKAMSFLIDRLPPQLHLVVMSRSDPAFPLHRLRAGGQIEGVYVEDLRFNKEEVASFFVKTLGQSLLPKDIDILERRTEGWVAGLQLAALSIQEVPDPSSFFNAFAGDDRYVSDYLIGEVFDRQPAYIQAFLIKTAILDRFSAPLCDTIITSDILGQGPPDHTASSKAIIDYLEQGNLFTVPLDNKREWYRYHHIFADFLRLRLNDWPKEAITQLHRQVAVWFEINGQLLEAIKHALSGEAYEQASHLIERRSVSTLWEHTQWDSLIDWVEALPEEIVRSRPRLSMQYAWALFTTGRWQLITPILNQIEALKSTGEKDTTGVPAGEIITLRAWLAFEVDDMLNCLTLSTKALKLLPKPSLTIRSLATLAQGAAYLWLYQYEKARPNLEKAVEIGLAADNMAVSLVALGCLVQLEIRLGKLHKAAGLYEKARKHGTISDVALLSPTGYACVQMGDVLREWGRFEEAITLLNEGIRLCHEFGGFEDAIEGRMILARVFWAADNESAAGAEMSAGTKELMAWVDNGGNLHYSGIKPALIHRARLWLARGEVARTASWLDEIGIQLNPDPSAEMIELYLLLARVFIVRKQAQQAIPLLNSLLPFIELDGRLGNQIERLVLLAIGTQECGDRESAVEMLSNALSLAEPEGYRQLFLDDWQSLSGLLIEIAYSKGSTTYASVILDAIPRSAIGSSEGFPAGAAMPITPQVLEQSNAESFTEREQSILQLIAAGLTNREIAAELFLSTNTIKTYSSRIYRKLDVHNRAEAVDRAHELGFL